MRWGVKYLQYGQKNMRCFVAICFVDLYNNCLPIFVKVTSLALGQSLCQCNTHKGYIYIYIYEIDRYRQQQNKTKRESCAFFVGVLFSYFRNSKTLYLINRILSWWNEIRLLKATHESTQLSCGNPCQIWAWHQIYEGYFDLFDTSPNN